MSDVRDLQKQAAADAALELVPKREVIGVGTGTTANYFIQGLARLKHDIDGAVASSQVTADQLVAAGIRVVSLTDVDSLPLYVDGADEANRSRQLIKGGGGALTREKIVAEASAQFICIIDEAKLVEQLGAFPLPVEVIPMATRLVAGAIGQRGGQPQLRRDFITDNGNEILDCASMPLDNPLGTEHWLNQIPGVVANGLFCRRPADRLLVGTSRGVCQI